MVARLLCALDTETDLLATGNVATKLVCAQIAWAHGVEMRSTGDSDLESFVAHAFDHEVVLQNAPFDLLVIFRAFPKLRPVIWRALEQGRVHDTMVREKLLNLATTGKMDFATTPDGANIKISYSLEALAKRWLGKDRSAAKRGADSWRLRYKELDGIPSSKFPAEARDYALEDAQDTLEIYARQEDRGNAVSAHEINEGRVSPGWSVFKTQSFQVGCAFSLFLSSAWGIPIDQAAREKIVRFLETELSLDKHQELVGAKLLIPPVAFKKKKNPDGTPAMTDERMDVTALKEHIVVVSQKAGLDVAVTATGRVATDKEVIAALAKHSKPLQQYQHRQKLGKLVSTEMPRLLNNDGSPAPRIHPCYDVLKETGRTSSYHSSLYASANIQNVDPRARGCYVPDPGWLMFSVDYGALDLVALGQVCFWKFGHSIHRDRLNAGIDLHAYLGSQIAFALEPSFASYCRKVGALDAMAIYREFMSFKKGDEAEQKFFKLYRKFAKPTGLGYPGGLGPATFIDFARTPYEVIVDETQARELRQIWLGTYPEMPEYFDWVANGLVDPDNPGKYYYLSPLGMKRAGAAYTAACNGVGLQTPEAEAAKLAFWNVTRACYDPALDSPLYGCRTFAFIHDEILGQVPDDRWAHERVQEVGRIMQESLQEIMPDMKPSVAGCLQRRWNKDAEPVYDEQKRLIVWEPKS